MHTIVLADDHPVVLRGLERFLSEASDFKIIASCPDGCTALEIIREKKPDLAVLDVNMPGLRGFDMLAATTQVVLLSDSATQDIPDALRNGAWAIISKALTASEMLDHLRRVAAGNRLLGERGPALTSEAKVAKRQNSQTATTLTPREREIAGLVAGGMSNKEIAQRTAVAVGTVKIHVSNILQKLNVNNRTSLAAVALHGSEIPRSASGRPSNFG